MTESLSKQDSPPGAALHIAIVTLFPELFEAFGKISFVGKAQKAGLLDLEALNLRDFGLGNHRAVDDTPYGGGSGMLLRADCVVAALERVQAPARRILLSPQGAPFTTKTAKRWARLPRLAFVCGRYEGFDERVRDFVDEEASLGDFVLTGGEVAAMAMIEATLRFCPGVLGNPASAQEESFSEALGGGLEYPHYTRPAQFRGRGVPPVLLSGDHQKIEDWRREQSCARTASRRPDLDPSDRRNKKPSGELR